ncbi:MAG: TIGR00341 family protein [Immundisolibacter sp.]|uniref:TIGR00341 family protein n=1 Tax=Immundisolibacter sp. TaxID=1934948 RepID=UPI0019948765|nr:TIGR00341 family protein [Immundisolibacter sp.]MBC7163222.1 TIGR00341 family protein [Immundisolibacter sp.]
MKYIEIVCDAGCADNVVALAEQLELSDCRVGPAADNDTLILRLLVSDDKLQPALDALQTLLGSQPTTHITVLPVEIALPAAAREEREQEDSASAAREALYAEVEKNTRLGANYLVLVLLSTAVAAIGLLKDDVAVVIGAMVIAPLLGPNLAFGLGTALGDTALMRKAALINLVGIGLVVVLAAGIGALRLFETSGTELLARTEVGVDSAVLALAAGAAAVLSLTTGLSSVLVGVMVAVALLPPAVVLGVMLGGGQWSLAAGAGLLLAVNLVCVNLACNVVFLIKGVSPRTWFERQRARRATLIYALTWVVTLLLLMLLIYLRQTLLG